MVLHARNEEHLTQSELTERTGLRQSDISRIEKGQTMPSIATFSKTAHGLRKRLEIRFISSYQQSTININKNPRFVYKDKTGVLCEEKSDAIGYTGLRGAIFEGQRIYSKLRGALLLCCAAPYLLNL